MRKTWIVKASDLKLGDRVRLFDGPYSCATVNKIKDGQVHFFRPFVRHDDFACGNETLFCYIGIEQFSQFLESNSTYELLERDYFLHPKPKKVD